MTLIPSTMQSRIQPTQISFPTIQMNFNTFECAQLHSTPLNHVLIDSMICVQIFPSNDLLRTAP